MNTSRKNHSPKFKKKVALEALKGDKTIKEIALKNSLHPTQITKWKKKLEDGMNEIFISGKSSKIKQSDGLIQSKLFEEIGRLKVELDWLKKKIANFN
jgi:transposase-like protein